MTVANLLANFPANAANLGKYARVSDLFGSVDDVMRCSKNGSAYYWRPQRSDYAIDNNLTSGSMTLQPLVTAPTVFLSGAMAANATVTPSATNAWPGMQFKVVQTGVLGLFGITLSGLITANVPLLSGASKVLTYTGTGFRAD